MIQSIFQALFGLVSILFGIIMFVWFFWAVGSAFESDEKRSDYDLGMSGGEIGGLIGLLLGVAFFVNWIFFT
jgi:hypothetical protein